MASVSASVEGRTFAVEASSRLPPLVIIIVDDESVEPKFNEMTIANFSIDSSESTLQRNLRVFLSCLGKFDLRDLSALRHTNMRKYEETKSPTPY